MYEEIVTKAIIGKGKKSFRNKYEFSLSEESNDILGIYIMNHKVNPVKENDKVRINGSFDTNIWYTFDNNTKTKVDTQRINYSELIDVELKENAIFNEKSEIEVEIIKKPTAMTVDNIKNILKYEIEKVLSIDIIGNTKVKVKTIEESESEEIDDINVDYLG